MANKNLQKPAMHVQSYCFVYWTYVKGYPPSSKNAAVQNRLGPGGLTGYLRDDLFLLLKEFISFFLSYLNLVIPLRFKKTKTLTCRRKQNPERIWYSKMTSSYKRSFLESFRIWLSLANWGFWIYRKWKKKIKEMILVIFVDWHYREKPRPHKSGYF